MILSTMHTSSVANFVNALFHRKYWFMHKWRWPKKAAVVIINCLKSELWTVIRFLDAKGSSSTNMCKVFASVYQRVSWLLEIVIPKLTWQTKTSDACTCLSMSWRIVRGRGRAPRESVWQFYVLPHMRQSRETMTSVSAGHIILTPTQPAGSGWPQRESNPGPPHQESRALPRPVSCVVFGALMFYTTQKKYSVRMSFHVIKNRAWSFVILSSRSPMSSLVFIYKRNDAFLFSPVF